MMSRHDPAFNELMTKALAALELAGDRFMEAREARKAGSFTVPSEELEAREQAWSATFEQLRDLTAQLIAES